jgi:hypothetical protein
MTGNKKAELSVNIYELGLIFDLTKTGYKVLFCALAIYQSQNTNSVFYMSCRKVQNKAIKYGYELSEALYYRGVKELLEKEVLFEGDERYFYKLNNKLFINRNIKKCIRP